MKYQIVKCDANESIPFEVTLRIETEDEAVLFHDKVACAISKSGPFIGACFEAISESCGFPKTGEVETK